MIKVFLQYENWLNLPNCNLRVAGLQNKKESIFCPLRPKKPQVVAQVIISSDFASNCKLEHVYLPLGFFKNYSKKATDLEEI